MDYAGKNGFRNYKYYVDDGYSALIPTEKDFKKCWMIKQCKARINEIDDLYAQLYEDLSKGLIPERRFKMMTDRLDKEQEELSEKLEQYENEKNSGKERLANIQDFIDEVSEYAALRS